MCPDDVNESTIRYLARTGILRGQKEGNRWQFQPSDAQSFCDQWHTRIESNRRTATAGRSVRRNVQRVLDGNGVAFLNLVASVASLVALAAGWLSFTTSLVLTLLNLVGAGLGWIWARARRPTNEDVVHGESVDPGAVEWSRLAGAWPALIAAPIVTMLATLGYVAVAASGFVSDDPPGSTPVAIRTVISDPCGIDLSASVPGATNLSILPSGLTGPMGAGIGGSCYWLASNNDRFEGDDYVADWEVQVDANFEPRADQDDDGWADTVLQQTEELQGCATATVSSDDIPVCLVENSGEVALFVYVNRDQVMWVRVRSTPADEAGLIKTTYPQSDLRTAAEQIASQMLVG